MLRPRGNLWHHSDIPEIQEARKLANSVNLGGISSPPFFNRRDRQLELQIVCHFHADPTKSTWS